MSGERNMELHEIEHKIACNEMTAAQVFTQMMQFVRREDKEQSQREQSKHRAIQQACRDCKYKWPKELSNGVMFYNGERITIGEFNKWARNFK